MYIPIIIIIIIIVQRRKEYKNINIKMLITVACTGNNNNKTTIKKMGKTKATIWILQSPRKLNREWPGYERETIREKVDFFVIPQSNVIRINYIKAINWYYVRDWYEMVYHIVSECCEVAQKEYNLRHDWVGKEIHLESPKKLKLEHFDM